MDRESRRRRRPGICLVGGLLALMLGWGASQARAADDPGAPWAAALRRVDDALTRREFGVALKAANEGYAAALASPRWDGMIAVGAAYRRIGGATGLHQSFDAKAREVYLKALTRARQQGSVDGVLEAGEGFVAIGDTVAAGQCVRIADRLAGRDPDARADVRAFAARLTDPSLAVPPVRP